MIRVCKLAALGGVSYPDVEDTPTAWQDLLGGYMETFSLPDILNFGGLVGIADDEGMRKNLPYNVYSPLLGQQILGTALIARTDPPEFVTLTDDDVAALGDWFDRLIVVG